MKLLLFGGTFDPPHKGHIHLLQETIRVAEPDKVIVMPAGIPPHKAASATPGELRLKMCSCFEGCHPDLEISGWEIARGGRNYTVDTLEMLREKYSDAEMYLSVGSDMLTTFTTWKEWRRLLQMAVLVVQSRQQGDHTKLEKVAEELRACGGRILFTGAPAIEAASSDIRNGKLGDEVLPPSVLEIAKQNHLYGR
ncbi:nicotinate (nicotinamide) nucleotide adenylyltransferase [gut metagenome]|uniref:Nicotinate (Nicotinamide) nucleotide adenylyltransferase n=1 Tax=gut metagenome TaxID=749906 RepID=J9D6H5_9ZZZZ